MSRRPEDAGLERETMSQSVRPSLDSARHDSSCRLRRLAVFLGLLNFVLWFAPPALGAFVDQATGRWTHTPKSRMYMRGAQELLVYFDPWLAKVVFPIVFTAGFAITAFLIRPKILQGKFEPGKRFVFNASLLLAFLEITWLYLIAIGIFFRDPDWNLAWPWNDWVPQEILLVNRVNLSRYFWHLIGRPVDNMFWTERELPGLVLVASYFLAGPVIAVILWRREDRAIHYWRWLVLILVTQAAALVPIKIALRLGLNIGYLIFLPEYSFNV